MTTSPHGIYHIVGLDGSGKSTIIDHLKQQYPATYIKEPSSPHYIDLINNTANIFKKIEYFAVDRFSLYKDIEFPLDQPLISDRSYICSLVYQSLELESQCNYTPFEAITHIYNSQLAIIKPTLIIYVHAYPTTIHHRLSNRGPSHYLTLDQIKAIQARYQLIFQLFNLNVLSIDTTTQSISSSLTQILSHLE